MLSAIGGYKLDIAIGWGLRVVNESPNAAGWVNCWVPGREDPSTSKSPSGSFHCTNGVLQDHAGGTTMPFFDIAVATGACLDWRKARDQLGDSYLKTGDRFPEYCGYLQKS